MPVEIRELIIRAVVAPSKEDESQTSTGSTTPAQREAIIQECVEQVLKILKKTKER